MSSGNNEEENDMALPSIRRKYQGGRPGRSNINYGEFLRTTKKENTSKTEVKPVIQEEKVIIKEETINNRGIAASPSESPSKITVNEGDSGMSQKQISITKTEVKKPQKGKIIYRAVVRNKENKESNISTNVENITTTNTNSNNIIENNKRDASQGQKIKQEVTTKTITTTTTNQVNRTENSGKKEIGKGQVMTKTTTTTTASNQRSDSQNQRSGSQNQRSGSQNQSSNTQKGQITSIKTIITNITTNERQNKGNNQGQIQKIEIKKEYSSNQRNSNSRGKSQDNQVKKDVAKEVKVYDRNNSRRSSEGKSQGKTVTKTKEVITNTERTSSRGRSQGQSQKKEVIKETNIVQKQSSRRESQNKKPQVVKEVTTSTSVNRRNSGNKSTVTTTKTITTANQTNSVNKGKKVQSIEERAKSLSISNTNKFGVHETGKTRGNKAQVTTPSISPIKKDDQNKKEIQKVIMTDTATNQKNIITQKPTSIINPININTLYNTKTNQVNSKLNLKEKEKTKEPKHYSTNTEIIKSRHNLSRITINESGKTPKKQYVLNVRKLDRIQSNSKMQIKYINDMEEKGPVQTNFNHNIVVIKNITKEWRGVYDENDRMKLIQKIIYNKDTPAYNVGRKFINESTQTQQKEVHLTPRKIEIIKTKKKPFKLNYKNYNEQNGYTKNKIEVKTNLQNKLNNVNEQRNSRNSRSSRNNRNSRGSRNSRNSSRDNSSGKINNDNKVFMTETKMKIGRTKTELNMGNMGLNKIYIKTSGVNTGNNGKIYNKLEIKRNSRNIAENSGLNEYKNNSQIRGSSTNSRGSKVEVVTNRRSSRNKQGGNEASGVKVTTVKTNQVIVGKSGSGSINNSRSNSISRGNKESTITSTKTMINTTSKISTGKNGVQGTVVKKVRTIKRIKI